MHGGSLAVRGGECGDAVALAVSLKLVPHGTLGAAAAGMLSIDGRCKTLDARANGYARSEGVGAVVLRSCGDMHSAVELGGSAVRQDGRSASLTAPNGSAQRTLLLATLGHAAVAAVEVGCTEAHGTGTALGDPTEAGALVAVHGVGGRSTPLAVGAAKGSVGHSEAASGQVGLLKVQRLLTSEAAAANPQLRVLNPLVGARLGSMAAHFAVPTQDAAAVTLESSCVSSFGYSGTIAHAAMQCGTDIAGTAGLQLASPSALVYHRRAFRWHERRGVAGSSERTQMYVCAGSARLSLTQRRLRHRT